MANRFDPLSTTVANRVLPPPPASSVVLDAPALAMEHVLASLARVEARLDEAERRSNSLLPPIRPEPAPPYTEPQGWRGEFSRPRAITTTATSVTSQQLLGFPGLHNRNQTRITFSEAGGSDRMCFDTAWNRGRQPSAWDNPDHRRDGYSNTRQPTSWDIPGDRPQVGGYSEPPRFDQWRSEKPRYEKMKPPRFDGSEAVNWISRVQYYFDHMGTPEDHRLHYVVMMFEGHASEWIFNYRDNNPDATWADFLEDVRRRFDPHCFQNFIGLIAKLKQTGLLAEYNSTFETMLNRVRGVPEYILLPIYIEGLTNRLRIRSNTNTRHQWPQLWHWR